MEAFAKPGDHLIHGQDGLGETPNPSNEVVGVLASAVADERDAHMNLGSFWQGLAGGPQVFGSPDVANWLPERIFWAHVESLGQRTQKVNNKSAPGKGDMRKFVSCWKKGGGRPPQRPVGTMDVVSKNVTPRWGLLS